MNFQRKEQIHGPLIKEIKRHTEGYISDKKIISDVKIRDGRRDGEERHWQTQFQCNTKKKKKKCPALKFDRLSPKLIKKNKGVIKAKFS